MNSSKLVAPKIQQFMDSYLSSYSKIVETGGLDREKMEKFNRMMRKDPIIRFCIEVTFLYFLSIFGDYTHSKPSITKDVRASLENISGNWSEILKRISTCFWYGFSWSELAFDETVFSRLIAIEIHTLDPSTYDFVGDDGKVIGVQIEKNGVDVVIPYEKGIHVVIGGELSFDYLYGCGRLETIEPYYDLHTLIMPVLGLAAKKQSTPILIKKTQTGRGVELYDYATGEPIIDPSTNETKTIPNGLHAVQQLSELDSTGVAAIDVDEDLFQIEPKLASDFLMELVKYLEAQKMLGLLVPPLIGTTSMSGLGDSNLSEIHLQTFHLIISSMVKHVAGELIEQFIKPLIQYNFGVQKDYGSFEIADFETNQLKIVELIGKLLQQGNFKNDDIDALNCIRRLLKLPEINEEYFLQSPQK